MDTFDARIKKAFSKSRKLQELQPNADQINNVKSRIKQVFTQSEIDAMDAKQFLRQVERVWPIARYVDRK